MNFDRIYKDRWKKQVVFDTAKQKMPKQTTNTPHTDVLALIKAKTKAIPLSQLASVGPLDHTMYDSIGQYVQDKIPTELLDACILNKKSILIESIFPHEIEIVKALHGENIEEMITYHHQNKYSNFTRPSYFSYPDKVIVAVTPGIDYLRHYASMILHYTRSRSIAADKLIKVVSHPVYESAIPEWTNFVQTVGDGDVMVLGYVDQFSEYLKKCCKTIESIDTPYYWAKRYNIEGKLITLVGVKYSYWGSISALLVKSACSTGYSSIVYLGKLGSLVSHDDVYTKLFSPTRYCMYSHDKLVYTVTDLINSAVIHDLQLDTGTHVSVPTILEETYVQRDAFEHHKPSSIDNEISQMARAISTYNKESKKQVRFTPIHIATDYLRNSDQRQISTDYDLSNHRVESALSLKQEILEEMFRVAFRVITL